VKWTDHFPYPNVEQGDKELHSADANTNGEVNSSFGSNAIPLARKSWTAYVLLALRTLIIMGVISTVSWAFNGRLIATLPFLAVVLVWSIYQFLMLRSIELYYDDHGVWIQSGVLPWNTGVNGVKWRDIDEALMLQSLWSWMFKSYAIVLKQRFTKATEIRLSHMRQGDVAVAAINETLFKKFSNSKSD
jgi:hypothetical protein